MYIATGHYYYKIFDCINDVHVRIISIHHIIIATYNLLNHIAYYMLCILYTIASVTIEMYTIIQQFL